MRYHIPHVIIPIGTRRYAPIVFVVQTVFYPRKVPKIVRLPIGWRDGQLRTPAQCLRSPQRPPSPRPANQKRTREGERVHLAILIGPFVTVHSPQQRQKMSTVKVVEQTLLYKYLGQLATNPLRTKALTNATLNAIQEILASYLAGEKSKNGSYVSERVPKMMIYGMRASCRLHKPPDLTRP